MPTLKMTVYRTTSGKKMRCQVGMTCRYAMTAMTAMHEKPKLTSSKMTFSMGKTIFSMRIFLIIEDESTMERIA